MQAKNLWFTSYSLLLKWHDMIGFEYSLVSLYEALIPKIYLRRFKRVPAHQQYYLVLALELLRRELLPACAIDASRS